MTRHANFYREKVIDAIFDSWCDGDLGMKTPTGRETDEAIDNIARHFDTQGEGWIFIETELEHAVCAREEVAFKDGFYCCLELLNGNVFKGGYHETGSQDCCENE